jgi:hypothetical protein
MDIDELNQEVLECSRYGEDDDLTAVLDAGADANFADEGGNTGSGRRGFLIPHVLLIISML